ncbi:MAG: OmpA family protein [Cytophagaceae bacterium]|nr:OmpA family protein [Cytophagaceae bacterium]
MKKISFLLFLSLIILSGCMNKAQKAYLKGEKKFKQGEYEFAIQHFQDAITKGYDNKTIPNYYIAESYRLSNRIQQAEPFYKAAIENKTTQEEAYFYYGYAQKAIGNYEGAEETFKNYVNIGNNFDFINRAKNEIQNLKVLNGIVNKKSYYTISKIDHLNSKEEEYAPLYYKDKLYFTSSRGAEKMHAATGTGFTDLYEFIFDGVEKHSGQAKELPEEINTLDAHEASIVFSKDGNTAYFARGNTGSRKGSQDVDIYMTTLGPDGKWTAPVKLPFNDDNAWDSSPALSLDGKTLYFASNREGSGANGGTDIYRVSRNADGTWGDPVNMGSPINTRGNEMYPYVSPHGDFYFSSDGHPSLGKLDLFMLKKDDNKKVFVENLGKPMNTSFDDFAIAFRDTIFGYLSSDRPDGEGGDDIYEFKDESRIKIVKYWLDLTVYFTEKKSPGQEFLLPGAVVKVVNQKGDTIGTITSDDKGKARMEVEPETNYMLIGSKPGHFTEEMEFSTVGKKVNINKLPPGETNIEIPAKMVLPKKEKIIFVVDNIYYDFNKANIRPDAAIELFKIVEFLRINPDISIELSSHTDNRGSAEYNRKLAQRRADSAVAFIVSKGIPKERIVAKGYGEDRPLEIIDSTGKKTIYTEAYINKLATKEEQEVAHQKNRRTEMKITNIKNPDIEIRRRDEEGGGFILEKEDQ